MRRIGVLSAKSQNQTNHSSDNDFEKAPCGCYCLDYYASVAYNGLVRPAVGGKAVLAAD